MSCAPGTKSAMYDFPVECVRGVFRVVNFISTDDIYDEFRLQAGDIHVRINRRRRWFAKFLISCLL